MAEPPPFTGPAAGISVTTGKLNAVLIDDSGAVAASHGAVLDPSAESMPQMLELVRAIGPEFGEYRALGIAVPGLINRRTNRVEFSAEFPEHSRMDIVGEMAEAAHVQCVIENDANAAGYGEFRFGAGRGANELFYATLGKGIGGCFIFGGEIWRGGSGFAGEFGYITINSDGMRLEDVASGSNIVRRTLGRIHQDSTSVLSKLDEQAITITDIVGAARNEDDFALLMLERTGLYVGSAIASVINLLNIELILIGGEIMGAGPVMLEAIKRRAREFSFGPSFSNTRIAAGELGGEAAAIGAAIIAAESISQDRYPSASGV